MEVFTYIVSISLQVAGALLLMFFSLSTKRKQVIGRFVNKNLVIRDSDEKLKYDTEELKNTFRIAYLNKFSFGFIASGYLLGIYGNLKDTNLLFVMVGVILGSVVLMLIAYFSTSLILHFSKSIKQPLTEAELTKYGLEPNMTIASSKEIDEMWNRA